MTSQENKEAPLCEYCNLPKTWWRNTDKYYYWICHPCKHKRFPAKVSTVRAYNLKKKGITPEQYQDMLESQNGLCAVCKGPEIQRRDGKVINLNVDHDHRCCKEGCPKCIRGLLCSNCNRGIGKFHDDISKLESAILYLKKYNIADLPESV